MAPDTKLTLEEIVDIYVQRSRSKLRPTEYERSRKNETTLHHVIENDEFRVLDHIIAVKDRRVEWIWRTQDFWPTDQLTDITISNVDLRNYGVIHGTNRITGVKFTIGPRSYAGPDPDACLPFVNDYLHMEAHYRWDGDKMGLQRARIGVDFKTKDALTLRARSVEIELARFWNLGYRYRSSLGSRLLVRVEGDENLRIDVPTELDRPEVNAIFETVMNFRNGDANLELPDQFVIERE